jgi:PAS domain S-box-containing protein
MATETQASQQLLGENERLRTELAEAQQTLDAIRQGHTDAILVEGPGEPRVYMLTGADQPYLIMVEEMQEGALTLRDDGLIMYCNRQVTQMLRTTHQGLLGKCLSAWLTPASQPLLEALLRESLEGSRRAEVTLLAADGTQVPVLLALRVLSEATPRLISAVLADLTEQKRHREMMASATFASSILDQAADAVVVCDASGRIVRANQAAHRLCGGNSLVQPFCAAYPLHTPARVTAGEPAPASVPAPWSFFPLTTAATDFPRGLELDLVRPDGERFHLLLSFGPLLDTHDKLLGCIITMTDVTQRRQMEDALRHSEFKYRMVADNTYDWEFWLDPEDRFVYCSRSCENVTGRAAADFLAHPQLAAELIHPDDRAVFERHRRDVEKRRAAGEGEWRFLLPDGTVRWIAHVCQPVVDEDGAYLGVRCSNRDVTDRKHIEESLRQKEEQHRLAVQATNDGIWDIDLTTGGVEWTETFVAAYGRPEDHEDPWQWWREHIHPEDRERIYSGLRAAIDGNDRTWSAEYRFLMPDGAWADVFDRAYIARDASGRARRIVGAMLDLTWRKRAERQSRLLSEITARLLASEQPQQLIQSLCHQVMTHLDCQAFVNFLVDDQGRGLRLNAYAGMRDEMARKIEWLNFGDSASGCVAHGGAPLIIQDVQHAPSPHAELLNAAGIQAYACYPLVTQGRVIGTLAFATRTRPSFAEDDLGLMKSVADHVTFAMERTDLLESLRRHAQVAQIVNEAKSRFLANISHELRTPMNAILGMIDLALPKASDPTVRDCLQTARGSADLLLTLLNDLLDSAKIESSKLQLEVAPFSLRRMLDQIARVLAVRASEKGLRFSCGIADATPEVVLGDRTRLQQVLLNLAGNAIKFTERGEVEIAVDAVMEDGEARLGFAVRDTGIGIPRSSLEHLFQPFAQADASMARRFGGTGLGLSIAKSLVELMGGQIRVRSDVGVGSTFEFAIRLPLVTQLPPDFEAPLALPAVAATPLRILVVEDNSANQKLATYILRERGHMVELAGDGQEAVDLTEMNRYDVILMDVQMPGMNGLDATVLIRRRERGRDHVPIIAMTAHTMKDDRERCLAAGMDGYLAKPVSAPEMIGLAESLAGRAAPPDAHVSAPADPPPPDEAAAAIVFDPDVALARCFNSADMVREMIRSFFEDAEKLVPQMHAALGQGDLGQVGRLGHRLKGTAMYLGAEAAEEAALRVEQLGREGRGPETLDADDAVHRLEQQCLALKAALLEYSSSVSPAPSSSAQP